MAGYTEIFAWGGDTCGQLGLGDKDIGHSYSTPRFCSFNILIQQISCGEEHTAFITTNGLIYAIGSNADGRLGIGDRHVKYISSPCLVEIPARTPAQSISCGYGHTAASLEDGSLYTWGLGEYGVLGTGDTISQWRPVQVPLQATARVSQVSCGCRHTAFVTFIGGLWTCGSGDQGQLGTGRRDSENQFVQIPTEEDVASVSCGIFHTGFITSEGAVFTMGGNSFGQLGINSKQNEYVPCKVLDLEGKHMKKISCGHHTAALSSNGELYIWGSGIFGEFVAPQKVISLKYPVKDIEIGGCFGAAVDTNGMLWTWGSNTSGELGVGDYEPRTNPFPLVALQGKKVKQISCGGSFAIALGQDLVNMNTRRTQSVMSQHSAAPQPLRNSSIESNHSAYRSPLQRSPDRPQTSITPDEHESRYAVRSSRTSPLRRSPKRERPDRQPDIIRPSPNEDLSQARVRKLLEENARISEGKQRLQSDMLRQSDELRNIKENNSRLNDIKYEQQTELAAKEHEICSLNEVNRLTIDKQNELRRQVEALQNQCNDLEYKHSREMDLVKSQSDTKVIDAQNVITQERNAVVDAQNIITQERAQRQQLEQELEHCNNQRFKADETNKDLKQRYEELQHDLIAKNRELDQRINDLERLQREKTDLKREVDVLDRRNHESDQKCASEVDQNRKLEHTLKTFEAKSKNRELEASQLIDDLERQNINLQSQLDEARGRNKETSLQNSAHLNEIERKAKSIEDLENENRKLLRNVQDLEDENKNMRNENNLLNDDKVRFTGIITDLERTVFTLQEENGHLKSDLGDLETKNKQVFNALEKSISDKARDFKENTIATLNASPQKAPLRTQPDNPPRSPILDSYLRKRGQSGNLSTNYTPLRSPFGSPMRVSEMESKQEPVPDKAPERDLRDSMSSIPERPSLTPIPERLRRSPIPERHPRSPLLSRYTRHSPLPDRSSRSAIADRTLSRTDKSREGLADSHQQRMARAAAGMASEANRCRIPENTSPLRYLRRDASPNRDPVDNLKTNLAGIKSKLNDLQQNKATIEGKMADFEEKLRQQDDL